MIALLLLLALPATAACPETTTAEALTRNVARAEAAFAAMDLSTFTIEAGKIPDHLRCIGDILYAEEAASVHRVNALNAYLQQRPDAVVASFRSALATDPTMQLSSEIAPAGNLLRELFETAQSATDPPPRPLSVPDGTSVSVDGSPGQTLPVDRPAVVQMSAENKGILWAGVVPPGQLPPDWRAVGYVPPPSAAAKAGPRERRPPSVPWLVAAGSTALVSGSLYVAALSSRAAYKNPDNPNMKTTSDLKALRQRTNALGYSSMGLGVVAVGLGACAWLEVRW
jgi:hypothetical protein